MTIVILSPPQDINVHSSEGAGNSDDIHSQMTTTFMERPTGSNNPQLDDISLGSVPSLSDDDSKNRNKRLDEENDEPNAVHAALSSSSSRTVSNTYGGLQNLGNTCYMNSALQVLASLDEFTDNIRNSELPDCGDHVNDKFRQGFLDVMEKLSRGETVRPEEFKQQMDDRSQLFVGYRQQDAHEFLTTLLDLIDEDYKKKPPKVEDDRKPPELESETEEEEEGTEKKIEETAEKKEGTEKKIEETEEKKKEIKEKKEGREESKEETEEKATEEKEVTAEKELSEEKKEDAEGKKEEIGERKEKTEEKEEDTDKKKESVKQHPTEQMENHEDEEEEDYEFIEKEDLISLDEIPEMSGDIHESQRKKPRKEEIRTDALCFPSDVEKSDSENVAKNDAKSDTLARSLPVMVPLRSKSFSQLKVEDIEELIHGSSKSPATLNLEPTTPSGPRCKLVGGRMNTVDANITAFSQSDVSMEGTTQTSAEVGESDGCSQGSHEDYSPVESYFKTEVCVSLTCDSCKYTRKHTETYLHLSLEIGTDSGCVEDGLRRFFAPEKRELKCEKCFCETALQTVEITRLPRALLLHFKRFIVDVSPDYTSITYRKNQSPVELEQSLPLSEDLGVLSEVLGPGVSLPLSESGCSGCNVNNLVYSIRSIVNHIGASAGCGHYTADANRLYSHGERQWTRFNDSLVSTISEKEAISDSSRTVYMALYELSHNNDWESVACY